MFAIVFDLDFEVLGEVYPDESPNNPWLDIFNFLATKGFEFQNGNTYFGDATVTAVDCVISVQALRREYPWFKQSVRDIRMLRIEENSDLMQALD